MKTLLLFFALIGTAGAENMEALNLACRAYEKALASSGSERAELLRASASGFEEMARALPAPSGWLEYNLGTVELAAEDYGRAVLHLKRALELLPGEPRVQRNLLRAAALAGVETKPSWGGSAADILEEYWSQVPPRWWTLALIVFSWLAAVSCWKHGMTLTRRLLFPPLLLLLAAGGLLRERGFSVRREVVLLASYAPRTGLGESYPPAFGKPLPPGSVGLLQREESGWREVRWKTARGWLPVEKCDVVEPR